MTAQFLLEGTYPFSQVTQHSSYLDRGPAHFLSGLRVVILKFLHFARGLVGKQLTEEFLKFMSPVCKESCAERKVYSGFSTVFLSLLLLAVGVGFPAACFWR